MTKKLNAKVTVGKSARPSPQTKELVIDISARTTTDMFSDLYKIEPEIITPTYNPDTLEKVCNSNNTVPKCIQAMCTNIDGTGHTIKLVDGLDDDEEQLTKLDSFFKEPYPNKSMISIRTDVRQDIETTGNGYIEVIRNSLGDIVMINSVPSREIRILKLTDPVVDTRTIIRNGQPLEIEFKTRPRRYVRITGKTHTYYKEFGTSAKLDYQTGQWVEATTNLASELIHLKALRVPSSPYGEPRWISQIPSVLGSRKAEEFNLTYFDNGGVPPIMVLVQGGVLASQAREDIENGLSAQSNKHRAVVIEVESTSGTIDGGGSPVKVDVERFGAERQADAMFQSYDVSCERRVRTSFRLPPLFVGDVSDSNFATSYTSYMIAEAQVFSPERDLFDTMINNLLVPSVAGGRSYEYCSQPLSLVDIATRLSALKYLADRGAISGDSLVESVNVLTGLSLEYSEEDWDLHSEITLSNDKKELDVKDGALDNFDTSGVLKTSYIKEHYRDLITGKVVKAVSK